MEFSRLPSPCSLVSESLCAEAKTEVSASRRKNKSGCDIRANPDIAKFKASVYGQGQPDGGINRQCRMLTTDVPWLLPFRRSRANRSVRTGKQVAADFEPCVYGAGSDELRRRSSPHKQNGCDNRQHPEPCRILLDTQDRQRVGGIGNAPYLPLTRRGFCQFGGAEQDSPSK